MARRTGLFRNPISYLGALLMALGAALIVAFLAMQFSLGPPSPYLGIFAFLVFPSIVFLGGVVVVAGMVWESRRRRRLGPAAPPPYPRIDLNDAHIRARVGWVLVGGVLGAMLLVYVAYNTFLFTESVPFCGAVCHEVMEPEYVAYQSSPHAQVTCVQCHIGEGVSWYVKSKLSGLRQVAAVTFDTYERPIRVPTSDLRPARATCEECHWPDAFLGAQLTRHTQFSYNEQNTATELAFLVNTGGGQGVGGRREGVHWHIDPGVEVTYAALDDSLQVIPWMRVRRPDGSVEEYSAADLTREQIEALPGRTMDCMDCHNRPSHQLGTPDDDLDEALVTGRISVELPSIKEVGFRALVKEYASTEEALSGIKDDVTGFYQENHADQAQALRQDIAEAVAAIQDIYRTSVFPRMRAGWGTYPQNVTHKNFPGCFRCHDGQHVTADGRALVSECTTCHSEPQRTRPDPSRPVSDVLSGDFDWHIWPLEERHAEIRCDRCHSVTRLMRPDCAECHQISRQAPHINSIGCQGCHPEGPRARPVADCRECHDDLLGLHEIEGHAPVSCNTCHPWHTWEPEGRDTCLLCHSRMDTPAGLPPNLRFFHEEKRICWECHRWDVPTGPTGFPTG